MKLKVTGISVVLLGLMWLGLGQTASATAPVAKLIQAEGNVEYSRNGEDWHPVRKTKYLFPGYTIRTGDDGSGRLVNQQTGKFQNMGSSTMIEIGESADITVIAGNLSKAEEESGGFFQGLMNKFAKAQRYTTVRRGITTADGQCDNKVRTVSNVTLSPSFPELVWRNACPEYSYRLVINDEAHHVSAEATAEMIRFDVGNLDLAPGEHVYRVEVLDNDGVIYNPNRGSNLTWLSADQEKQVLAGLKQFEYDVFLQTNYLEDHGMYVAAMDKYREFFREFPEEHEMRPMLIQSYQELKLSDLRENEARLYQAKMNQEF